MPLRRVHSFSSSIKFFIKRMNSLIKHPVFISLSIFGNLVIFSSAVILLNFEKGINPQITSLIDTIWWATSTVTTVGYGDVIPITDKGRILGLFTMIIGTALFWSYTALFAEVLLSEEIDDLEYELKAIQNLLSSVKKSDVRNQSEIKKIIEKVENQVQTLKKTLQDG